MRKSGFTLIELLIVIAIIVILAAVLFPVFATAREKARQTACASNMKQLGLALTQYSQDFDEVWPNGMAMTVNLQQQNPTSPIGWANAIYPYVKSVNTYMCPNEKNGVFVSVAANCNIANDVGTTSKAVSQFIAPASSVGLFEVYGMVGKYPNFPNNTTSDPTQCAYGSYAGNGTDTTSGYVQGSLEAADANTHSALRYATGVFGNIVTNTPNAPQAPFSGTGRHSDGANYVMLDGHAKWCKASQVSAGHNNTVGSSDPGNYVNGGTSTGQYPTLSAATTGYCGGSGVSVTFSVF